MSATPTIFHDFLGEIRSRKLLLDSSTLLPNHQPTPAPPPSTANYDEANNDVLMVVSILLCGFICSLGLKSLVKCAIRRSSSSESVINNTGVKQKELSAFPIVSFSAEMKQPGFDSECAICLTEFAGGDGVRLLPICSHGFHVRCIDQWLKSHSSCPKCRSCLIQKCEKMTHLTRLDSSSPSSSQV